MNKFEKFMILFLIVFFLSFSLAVIKTAYGGAERMEKIYREMVTPRPSVCSQYYNDGSNRWINCMGVGYK